jgi:hypothetical protein
MGGSEIQVIPAFILDGYQKNGYKPANHLSWHPTEYKGKSNASEFRRKKAVSEQLGKNDFVGNPDRSVLPAEIVSSVDF